MTITIQEAKTAKAALEHSIAAALRQFTADTGMTVEYVSVSPQLMVGCLTEYHVQVEARL